MPVSASSSGLSNSHQSFSSSTSAYQTPSSAFVELSDTSPPSSYRRSPGVNGYSDFAEARPRSGSSTTSSPRGSMSGPRPNISKANGSPRSSMVMTNGLAGPRRPSGQNLVVRRDSGHSTGTAAERGESFSSARTERSGSEIGLSRDARGSVSSVRTERGNAATGLGTAVPAEGSNERRRPSEGDGGGSRRRPFGRSPSGLPRPSNRRVSAISTTDGTPSSKPSNGSSVSRNTESSATTAPSVDSTPPSSIRRHKSPSQSISSDRAVPIAVVQPSPDRPTFSGSPGLARSPRVRRKSSTDIAASIASSPRKSFSALPLAEGSRRTSYHLEPSEKSMSSSSSHRKYPSESSTVDGTDRRFGASSSVSSTGEYAVPEAIDLASSGSASEDSRTFHHARSNSPLNIEIPKRRYSASLASPPQISPRKSSMAPFTDQDVPVSCTPPMSPARRASKAVALGEVFASTSRLSLTRTSGSSLASRRSESSMYPSNPASPRPDPRLKRQSPFASPISGSHPYASQSPRVKRRSPNLILETPTPAPIRRTSSTARPSPPIPAKSPLRSLSRRNSSFSDLKGGPPRSPRSASGDSNLTIPGTPMSPDLPQPIPEEPPEGLQEALPGAREENPQAVRPPRGRSEESFGGEIRFTAITVPSVYSQDSAPSTAKSFATSEDSAMSPRSEGLHEEGGPRTHLRSFEWGRKRDGRIMDDSISLTDTDETADGGPSLALPRLVMPDRAVPAIPSESPATATTANTGGGTTSDWSNGAANGHTPDISPMSPSSAMRPPRSPSMPMMNGNSPSGKAASLLELNDLPVSHSDRSVTSPAPLMSSDLTRSPTAPNMVSQASSMSTMSKRSHLIREIANTERAHAHDLALIRDAYLLRHLRPASQHSVPDSSTSPGDNSDASIRNSVYTYQTAGTKRSSGHESLNPPWAASVPVPMTSLSKRSSTENTPYASLHSSTAAGSTTSFQFTTQPSPRQGSRTSSMYGGMPPPIGKPLSPADTKNVFLNLDQLAAVADELATAFEAATGEEVFGPGAVVRGGEVGTDRLGEVFVSLLPRLRPLYGFYCARQSTASVRLVELQSDPAHAAYLNDCWALVKPRTRAWNLDSMLIKPVQRITKYPLLFEDLLASTTPVHPDYFSIRTAAEMARSVAMEIDEAKRRKDAVARAIAPKRPLAAPIPNNQRPSSSKGRTLNLFKKDKVNGTASDAMSKTSSDVGLPSVITPASFALLKDLIKRIEEGEQVVRQVGKEVILWTAAAKELCVVEVKLMGTWLRVYQLDFPDVHDWKLSAFRIVLEDIYSDAWAALNDEIKERVMPIFAKLLDASVNPRKVVAKRDFRISDYSRYVTVRDNKRAIDKALLHNAREFTALHAQLMDELPAFLEGYMRILDIAMIGFAGAQARYHATVRDRIAAFAEKHARPPRRVSNASDVINLEEQADLSDGRGIIKAWYESWHPYAEAMDHFQCTLPSRAVASRIASFNNRPGSRPTSRSGSPLRDQSLHHSPSMSSQRSFNIPRSGSPIQNKSQNRARAISLLDQQAPNVSPVKESRFGLLRANTKKAHPPASQPNTARDKGSQPSSLDVSDDQNNRYSFGLPKISADPAKPIFDGLGLSPTKPNTPAGMRVTSDPQGYANSPRAPDFTQPGSNGHSGFGLGDVDTEPPPVPPRPSMEEARPSRAREGEIDAAEGWRNERVLYQCACVADFDPAALGNRKYRGLRFLRMDPGDLVDVFHEVGRIDELPSFPHPEVGVDNDGVLVGSTENGAIGLVICSFLEPLRD